MNRTLRTAVVAALLLAAGNTWALGLGQIQVKSKRNQPLLAEIPIISTTPGELAALQARLASPETFRRVGLAPPSGIAADLHFTLGSDAKGRPVIRVTTLRPVEQGTLGFLIEVDWGAGRLVREYAALVDVPTTAGAVVQPDTQLPQAAAPNLVQRPLPEPSAAAAPAPAPVPAAVPQAAAPSPSAEPAAEPAAEQAPSVAIAPLPPAPASRPAAAPVVTPAPGMAQYGPVKQGETLSKIASGLDVRRGFSLDQTMLALLRANPDAFLGDDINQLRSGAVLHVPASEDVAGVDAGEAAQLVRQQMQHWQQARRAVRQPEVAAAPVAPAKPAADAAVASAASVTKPQADTARPRKPVAAKAPARKDATPAVPAPAPTPAMAAAPRRSEARLQIVPPAAPGKATGTKSGTHAGGEGSMLQQELRRRDEDIAAKTAEIGELKERVAALERLKDEQQKMISLKDSELAAAQANLAQANKAVAQPAPATPAAKPKAETAQAVPAAPADHGGAMPYVWGGIGVTVLALSAWLLAGRRKSAKPPVRRSMFDSEALAASMVAPVRQADDDARDAPAVEPEMLEMPEPAEAAAVASARGATVETVIDLSSVPPAPPRMDAPAWHSGWVQAEAPGPREPLPPATPVTAEVAEATEAAQTPPPAAIDDDLPTPTVDAAPATAEQRLKLVRAFLDMGDEYSAQQLLLELLDDPDQAASDEAARMLSKLVG